MKAFFQTYPDLLNGFDREIFLVSEDGTLVFASQRSHELLDYKEEVLAGNTILDINPNFSKLSWKKFWRKLSKREWLTEETELISQKEIIFPVVIKARLFEWDGQEYCFYLCKDHHRAHRFEELLNLTSKVSRIGAWSLDLVSAEVSFTTETARLLGLKDKGFDNQLSATAFFRHLRSIMDDHDWKRLFSYLKQAVYKGIPFETELNISGIDGFPHRHNVHTLVQYSDEKASQLYGTLQDISTLVERSDDMYMAQFTVDHAREMIFWLRKDGSLIFVNEMACQKLGYSRSELLEVKAFGLSPDFPESYWPEHWENLRENRVLDVETTMYRKDGSTFPIAATIIYLVYQGEEYNCSFIRDLSAKKEREQLIQLSQNTIDQSQDLILWLEPDGKIIFSNQTARNILGYSQKELEQLAYPKLYQVGEQKLGFKEIWAKLLNNEEIANIRQLKTKKGKAMPVEVLVTQLQFQGRDCACVRMINLTEKAQKETQLRRAYEEIKKLKERLEEEKTYLQEELSGDYSFNNIVTKSPRYRQVLRQITQVADTDTTVLILGETGTGKELLARAIHELSDRDDQPLVKVNCAALPENLIESELFGHEKGAFTGAYQRKIGRFELADNGTIFLDEIGEMPLELQSKLLRVLQESELQRLGSTETLKVDVRVIAATNRELEKQVAEGKFREDLYYRLNVFPIHNLPLRERKDDIPLLVQYFVKKFADKIGRKISKIPSLGMEKLMKYEFPGNVRELENIIERAVVLSRGESLDLAAVLPSLMKANPTKRSKFQSLEEVQRDHIIEALNRTHWKVTGKGSASELLGINGKTLASRMRKLGIARTQYSDR